MRNKKRIIIITLRLIFIFIASSVFIVSSKKDQEEAPMISGTEFYGESKNTLEDYYPKGLFNLTKKYNGTQSNLEIKDRTSKFIKLVQKLNEKESTSYFNENRNELREFGIITQEQFDELVNKIKSLNQEELIYENSRFDTENIEKEEGYLKVKIYIKFENCDEIEFTEKIQEERNKENLDYIFS